MRGLACAAVLALAALARAPAAGLASASDDAFPTARDRALMQWFKDGGGELHQVVYSVVGADEDDEEAVETARRGLFAKEAVAAGAPLVTLGAPLVLTLARSAMPHKDRLDKLAQRRPECALAAALLWEKHAPASAWAPYIATLPEALPSVAFARSAAAREALQGSHAAHHLAKYWANEAKCYGELESALFRASPSEFPVDAFHAGGVTWALATVRARSFAVARRGADADLALLPLAELLPRGAPAGRACAGAGAAWERGAVVVRGCDARRSEEAALPRAGLSDADALARRGALPAGSSEDVADVDAALPIRLPAVLNTDDDAAARRARHAAMPRCGAGGDARAYTAAGATQQLLCAARTAQAPMAELRATPPPDFTKAADMPTEAAVLDALVDTAEDLLAGFATSPAEDRAALARIRARGGGGGACAADDEVACRREAIAAALREKLLLLAARDALATRRDAMPVPKKQPTAKEAPVKDEL